MSNPEDPWPKKVAKKKKKRYLTTADENLTFDSPNAARPTEETPAVTEQKREKPESEVRPETPSTTQPPSQAHSEHAPSTTPTTPTSAQPVADGGQTVTPTNGKAVKAVPVPLVPALPKKGRQPVSFAVTPQITAARAAIAAALKEPAGEKAAAAAEPEKHDDEKKEDAPAPAETPAENAEEPAKVEDTKPAWSAPKSWASLLAKPQSAAAPAAQNKTSSAPAVKKTNTETLVDAFTEFKASSKDSKIAFLEPRGLVNTGNMCYMNSVSLLKNQSK